MCCVERSHPVDVGQVYGDSVWVSKPSDHGWATAHRLSPYITTCGIMGLPESNGTPPNTMCLELKPSEQIDGGEHMTDSMTTNQISENEREAILKALVSYYWPHSCYGNAACPPSTGKATPVTKEASSLARNRAAAAISSGEPNRPMGCSFANA